jgi:DNA modification methylase
VINIKSNQSSEYSSGMTSPIFIDDVLTLYNADLTNVIQHLNFNYIITDPPYNVGYKYPDYNDNLSSADYIALLSNLEPHKTVMIHYPEAFIGDVGEAMGIPNKLVQWVYNSNLGRQHRSIGWFGCKPDLTKVRQPYKNPNDKRIKKLIADGSTGTRLYDWWEINLVKNVSKDKVASFTNQIPIEVLERIILTTTNEGDTILDPFFGSGSIYFACKKTNRKCIGIEQSKTHIDAFMERKKASI